jgi:hypothetical protein
MMQKRIRNRVRGVLPLRIQWTDEAGKPHNELAHSLDLSTRGVRLGGLRHQLAPNAVVTVKHKQWSNRFRVVWIKPVEGTPEFQAGLESLETGKDLWGLELDTPETAGKKS